MRPGPALGRDDGNISMLTLGFAIVAVLLTLTVAAATGVHLDRLRLARLADDVALDVSDSLDLAAYYAGSVPEPGPEAAILISEAALRDAARQELARQAPRYGLGEVDLVSATSPDGNTVVVTVAARSPLLFRIDALLPWSDGIVLTATSAARAY